MMGGAEMGGGGWGWGRAEAKVMGSELENDGRAMARAVQDERWYAAIAASVNEGARAVAWTVPR